MSSARRSPLDAALRLRPAPLELLDPEKHATLLDFLISRSGIKLASTWLRGLFCNRTWMVQLYNPNAKQAMYNPKDCQAKAEQGEQ
jgi:hypothetical protein